MGPYPDPKYYSVDQMYTGEVKQFFSWYDSLPSDRVFDFQRKMLGYCDMDEDTYAYASEKF